MNKDALYRYFEQHYIPKRDMLPRIPLGMNPDELWTEILGRRKAKSTQLPVLGPRGLPYWYVTTEKMVSASEMIVEELMAYDGTPLQAHQALSPLEEVFYTSYVEGSPMSMQEAMEFLQGDMEPGDVREQMIVNNRSALSFAGSNLYHPVDGEYIRVSLKPGILACAIILAPQIHQCHVLPGCHLLMNQGKVRELIALIPGMGCRCRGIHQCLYPLVCDAWRERVRYALGLLKRF